MQWCSSTQISLWQAMMVWMGDTVFPRLFPGSFGISKIIPGSSTIDTVLIKNKNALTVHSDTILYLQNILCHRQWSDPQCTSYRNIVINTFKSWYWTLFLGLEYFPLVITLRLIIPLGYVQGNTVITKLYFRSWGSTNSWTSIYERIQDAMLQWIYIFTIFHTKTTHDSIYYEFIEHLTAWNLYTWNH